MYVNFSMLLAHQNSDFYLVENRLKFEIFKWTVNTVLLYNWG